MEGRVRISKKWRRMSEVYKYVAKSVGNCSFDEQAASDMYCYETYGKNKIFYYVQYYDGKFNGYAVGKHWFDVTLAMWLEDLNNGILTKNELYNDPEIPDVIKNIIKDRPLTLKRD